jgi:hypothetical protein
MNQVYRDAVANGFTPEVAQFIADNVDNHTDSAAALAHAREVQSLCRLVGKSETAIDFIRKATPLPEVKQTLSKLINKRPFSATGYWRHKQ